MDLNNCFGILGMELDFFFWMDGIKKINSFFFKVKRLRLFYIMLRSNRDGRVRLPFASECVQP